MMSGSKPLFVICVGTGWSATTPLYYTLQDAKIANAFIKESNILCPNLDFSEKYKVTKNPVYLDPTVDNYITFLHEYYQSIADEYRGVCDFTTSYATLPPDIISTFADKLKDNFNVKILMIFRDPVRRLFSHISHLSNSSPNAFLKEILFYLRKIPNQLVYPTQKYNHKLRNFEPFLFSNYSLIYDTWKSFFDTHYIIMEDLWAGRNNELERLNTFLGANITEVHENVYYPDRGANAPKLAGLADQWTSDTENLDPKLLHLARRMMSRQYQFSSAWDVDEWL
tara:strand:- start:70 stop:915 length:846 start_codon:yes stop_codon:yes gene_type:complete